MFSFMESCFTAQPLLTLGVMQHSPSGKNVRFKRTNETGNIAKVIFFSKHKMF